MKSAVDALIAIPPSGLPRELQSELVELKLEIRSLQVNIRNYCTRTIPAVQLMARSTTHTQFSAYFAHADRSKVGQYIDACDICINNVPLTSLIVVVVFFFM
jgi:hypothetical protein